MCILDFCIQLLLSHHVKMHDVADVEIEDPVLQILHTERVPHV